MKVFVDFHHEDLYFSLYRLFEERLGMEIYRPIGLDWFEAGYWKVAEPYGNAHDTINQFLSTEGGGWDPLNRLNGDNFLEDGIYHVRAPAHNYYHRAITFEKFKSMQFDLVISTIKEHDIPYEELVTKYQPQAKHIVQMGNLDQVTEFRHVLTSVPFKGKENQNVCFYHQEVDPRLFFYQSPNPMTKKIYGFVSSYPHPNTYEHYKRNLPEVEFRHYGIGCPEGPVGGSVAIAPLMREANLAWHIKPGDGFGHTVLDWCAIGRPIITKFSDLAQYPGQDAKTLFIDNDTCINLDAGNFQSNFERIRKFLEPEENAAMCERVSKRFREIVNYDDEEVRIREFLSRVI